MVHRWIAIDAMMFLQIVRRIEAFIFQKLPLTKENYLTWSYLLFSGAVLTYV